MVGVNVASNMPNPAIISNFVKRGQEARDQDLKTSRHMGVLFELAAGSDKVCRLAWLCGIRSLSVTIKDRINNLAEYPCT